MSSGAGELSYTRGIWTLNFVTTTRGNLTQHLNFITTTTGVLTQVLGQHEIASQLHEGDIA
jgi:hypothetical protein